MNFKIASWNINGIKSLTQPLKEILDDLDSDIICFQETKTNEDTLMYKLAIVEGYNSYFSFCQTKQGYAGVCIYCRNPITPSWADQGLVAIIKRLHHSMCDDISIRKYLELTVEELQSLEVEGRAICSEFLIRDCECGIQTDGHSVFVVNVYCPMAESDNVERQNYKMMFNKLLHLCVESILNYGSHVLLVGDLNIKHKSIDIAEFVPEEEFLSSYHRQWLDSLLVESQRCPKLVSYRPPSMRIYGRLIDTYRYLHPAVSDKYSCWNTKINARSTNFGTRIDYILCDSALLGSSDSITDASILDTVLGSDHCPVTATFARLRTQSPAHAPALCTANLPRFRQQTRITSFLVRTEKPTKRPAEETAVPPTKVQRTVLPKDSSKTSAVINEQWKTLFKGTPRPPRCTVHKALCVRRSVAKEGPNKGRLFWACSKPNGLPDNPLSKCNFFLWSAE